MTLAEFSSAKSSQEVIDCRLTHVLHVLFTTMRPFPCSMAFSSGTQGLMEIMLRLMLAVGRGTRCRRLACLACSSWSDARPVDLCLDFLVPQVKKLF